VDGWVFNRGVNVNRELPEAIREMRDIDGRLKHMDELDIDLQVLYPSLFLRPLTSREEVEAAICRSYNQWLIDICRRGEGRLRWIAVVPLIDIANAVAEVQFAKANGACGIFMRGLVDDKRLSHSFFFPLYAEAENSDLPICVHASTGSFDWVQLFEGENGFMRFKVPVLSAFHSIVHDGIPAKFPALRFGFIEVRAQWVPYMAVEIAKRFERENKVVARNIIRDNRVYVACQTDDDLPYVLKYAGEDNIVIGSDYGHNDTSSEIEALRLLKKKGEVEPRIIDKILYDNAQALYGI
jgi:predicted TIM-barrel fold metal-dependent hydrolase